MILVSFACNILQIWVIDNILIFIPLSKEEIKLLEYAEKGSEAEFEYNNIRKSDHKYSINNQISEIKLKKKNKNLNK